MNQIFHPADSRGLADHGWLLSRHSFSFAEYYNPQRMNFGLLRVLNDDIVRPAQGFGRHPHDNMEIISIPLQGALRHQDSMGHQQVIDTGEIQVMSAGSGLTHAEYNASEQEKVNFLQIWIYPEERNIPPRYDQRWFDPAERRNGFQFVVAPDRNEALWINQQAWLALADLEPGTALKYPRQQETNGVYFFLLDGQVQVNGMDLVRRDGLGLSGPGEFLISAESAASLLAIEIPLHP